MNQLKKSVQENALNSQDIYESLEIKKEKSFFKRVLVPSTVFAALLMTVFFGSLISAPTQDNPNDVVRSIAYFQLEINPQFEIAIDEDGLVVDIRALNDDAKTFELELYLNNKVEDVIEQLIALATEKGFINSEDDIDDFVTITSVVIDEENKEDRENVDSIGYRIRARIEASGEIDSRTNVIYIKATIREKMEAEGKEVPLGLYVINGMIEHEGEMIPVSEHVKSEKALEKMNKAGIIITKRTQDQTNKPIDNDDQDENDDEELEETDENNSQGSDNRDNGSENSNRSNRP